MDWIYSLSFKPSLPLLWCLLWFFATAVHKIWGLLQIFYPNWISQNFEEIQSACVPRLSAHSQKYATKTYQHMHKCGPKFYANSLAVAAVTGRAAQRGPASAPSSGKTDEQVSQTSERRPAPRTAVRTRTDVVGIYGGWRGQVMGRPRCQRPRWTTWDGKCIVFVQKNQLLDESLSNVNKFSKKIFCNYTEIF